VGTSARRSLWLNPEVNPTWVSSPVRLVQPEQERAHRGPARALRPPPPDQHCVGGALLLHLAHIAFAGAVGRVESLGHHAVEAGDHVLLEPAFRLVAVPRGRAEVQGRGGLGHDLLQGRPALGQRRLAEVAIAVGQQVERNERGGRLLRQPPHARFGGVDPLAEHVEVIPVPSGVNTTISPSTTKRVVDSVWMASTSSGK
jgi:hypothetical protein